jgi:hypothetical protein
LARPQHQQPYLQAAKHLPNAINKSESRRCLTKPNDSKSITGISEKVLVSHYENNYVGAVKRLNAIGTHWQSLISPRVRFSSSTD